MAPPGRMHGDGSDRDDGNDAEPPGAAVRHSQSWHGTGAIQGGMGPAPLCNGPLPRQSDFATTARTTADFPPDTNQGHAACHTSTVAPQYGIIIYLLTPRHIQSQSATSHPTGIH